MASGLNTSYTHIAMDVPSGDSIQNGSKCSENVPTGREVFEHLAHAPGPLAFACVLILCTLATIIIFFAISYGICKRYPMHSFRAKRTVYIMAMYPMLSMTALLGVLVPRSATLVDLVSTSYVATCIYVLMRLITDYLGGIEQVRQIVCHPEATLSLRSPPCCCCCFCLPKVKVRPRLLVINAIMVLQAAIVRPILMFFAAVAWADGNYTPGNFSPHTPCLYITILNLVSNLVAVYGLLLKRNIIGKYVTQFNVGGKIVTFQLTIITGVIADLVIGIIASQGLIPCTPYLPSKENVARVQHVAQVFLALLLVIFAAFNFRHSKDAVAEVHHHDDEVLTAENGTKPDDVIPVRESRTSGDEAWDVIPSPTEETAMKGDTDREPINV